MPVTPPPIIRFSSQLDRRPPLPIDLRLIAALNVIVGAVLLTFLVMGVVHVLIMTLLAPVSRDFQTEAAATLAVYAILIMEMALLILSGAQIYLRRLNWACLTLGIFVLPGVYALIRLPAMGNLGPVLIVLAMILAYPLVILLHLAGRAWTMRQTGAI